MQMRGMRICYADEPMLGHRDGKAVQARGIMYKPKGTLTPAIAPALRNSALRLAFAALALSAGCTGKSALPMATLTEISFAPPAATTPAGTQVTLTATERFSDSAVVVASSSRFAPLSWSSTDSSIATVDSAGVVTAIKPGTVTISANVATSTVMATASITVTDATLVELEVTPPLPTGPSGTVTAFTATGVYSDKTTHDLTRV